MKNNPIFYVFREILDHKNSKLVALRLWLQFHGEQDNKGNSKCVLGFEEIQEIKSDLRIKYKEFQGLLREIYASEACDVNVKINGEDAVIGELAVTEGKLRRQLPSIVVTTYNLYKEKARQKYIRITKNQYDFLLQLLLAKRVPSICCYVHLWLNIRFNVTYSDYVTDFLTLKKGECRTTHERLCCQTGLSDWQVRHVLSALVDMGLIKIAVMHKRFSQISLLNFVVEDEKIAEVSKKEEKTSLQGSEKKPSKTDKKESLDSDGAISKALTRICRTAASNNPEIENEKAIFSITYKKVMDSAVIQRMKARELAELIEEWFSGTNKCTVFADHLISYVIEKLEEKREKVHRGASKMTARLEAMTVNDIVDSCDEEVDTLYRAVYYALGKKSSAELSPEEKREILKETLKEFTSLEIAARYYYLVRKITCTNSFEANRLDELLTRHGSGLCERIYSEMKLLSLRTTVSAPSYDHSGHVQ